MTNSHPFDRALLLDRSGDDDVSRGRTSEDYWAFVGPFGGVSAGVLMRAVLDHPKRIGEPLALTVNYCAPLTKGEFEVRARPARTNRSTQHWTLELSQNGETILTGSAVTAERRESWALAPLAMPAVAPPETIEAFRRSVGGSSWIGQYEFRFAEGAMSTERTEGESSPGPVQSKLWLRDAQPRPLDHPALAAMADAFFGRVFHALGRLVPFGTVSLTTYFLGATDELAKHGDAYLLGVADAKRFNRSYADQTVELWGRDGTLLATSVQVAYFKV